jgi:hypothetical protein
MNKVMKLLLANTRGMPVLLSGSAAALGWADVFAGDYIHYFDLHARLYGATLN